MLDIQFIRENPDLVQEKSKQKGYEVDIDRLVKVDVKRRALMSEIEELRKERNEHAKELQNSSPTADQITKGKQIKGKLNKKEAELEQYETDYWQLLKAIPNMPLDEVPIGASEDENKPVKDWGEKPKFSFEPKSHWQIGEARGWIDKERAAKVAGARFAYLKGDLVRLHTALMSFAADIITDSDKLQQIASEASLEVSNKPFELVLPPLLIKTDVYDAMDRLEPQDDRYKIEGEELWLQGSAEHVLGSMHANEIIDEASLPIRYAGYATSFRKEAGTYGKDTEGILRMHQFDKLEMESLTVPEDSHNEYKFMIAIQEHLMQQLGLPYQVVMKCTADIGKPNAAGVDIEVWFPSQNKYRETHTADYMTDYQTRRLKTRFNRNDKTELLHTNDATALSQRPLIAIIENYQNEDGSIRIPEVLQPYMNGRETL